MRTTILRSFLIAELKPMFEFLWTLQMNLCLLIQMKFMYSSWTNNVVTHSSARLLWICYISMVS